MSLKKDGERAETVAKRYKDGDSIPEIAQDTGLTESTIKAYLSVMKIPRDEKRLEIGTEEADAWAARWDAARKRLINAGFRS